MHEFVEDRGVGHPDDEILDRLRAGLVEDSDTHRQLELHLASCLLCRKRAGRWDEVGSVLRKGTDALPHATGAELRMRRRAAFTPSPVRRFPTLATAAGAAVLVLGVGLATQFSDGWSSRNPAPPVIEDAPDLYAEIDFYLWLSQREEGKGRDERSGRNS